MLRNAWIVHHRTPSLFRRKRAGFIDDPSQQTVQENRNENMSDNTDGPAAGQFFLHGGQDSTGFRLAKRLALICRWITHGLQALPHANRLVHNRSSIRHGFSSGIDQAAGFQSSLTPSTPLTHDSHLSFKNCHHSRRRHRSGGDARSPAISVRIRLRQRLPFVLYE